jgi:hypothetical protein
MASCGCAAVPGYQPTEHHVSGDLHRLSMHRQANGQKDWIFQQNGLDRCGHPHPALRLRLEPQHSLLSVDIGSMDQLLGQEKAPPWREVAGAQANARIVNAEKGMIWVWRQEADPLITLE